MESQNPWWYREVDKIYEDWGKKEIKWIPPILEEFDFKPFSLNFLVGPRQVGKTTTLKIWINKYLLKSFDPKAIFYFSCEEIIDFKELGEILDNYISFRNSWNLKSSIIILDEITFVKDWYKALKIRIDQGIFKNDIIIISGSASLEILKEKEYFPGRRGFGKDIIFYPLSFNQYVKALGKIDVIVKDLPEVEDSIKANMIHRDVLKRLFEKYLYTGGFPLPIEEMFLRNKISFETMKVYIDWLKNDFIKLGRNESYMKEILSYIVGTRLTPISWLSISKETSIASPHTVQSYIEDLEKLFVVKILYLMDPDSKIVYRKNKKIHITDPFMYRTICEYTNTKIMEEDILESTIVSHLSRKYQTFYWRNKTEIDLIVKLNHEKIGIEVKKTLGSWSKPKHLKKIMVITREEAPIFLASIRV